MTAKKFLYESLIFFLFLPPWILIEWDEKVDPSFIASSTYDFFLKTLFPIFTIILSIIIFIFLKKKYNDSYNFRGNIKDFISEYGKLRSLREALGVPLLLYLWMSASICLLPKIFTHYHGGDLWQREYQLIKVDKCPRFYEYECSELTVLDLTTYRKRSFRWYADKHKLVSLQNKKLTFVGVKSPLGFVVDEIQW